MAREQTMRVVDEKWHDFLTPTPSVSDVLEQERVVTHLEETAAVLRAT